MRAHIIERAGAAAASASDPEAALRALLTPLHAELGRREGAFDSPDEVMQFFVAGAFLVTPGCTVAHVNGEYRISSRTKSPDDPS